jgi:hypothetical protein
MPSCDDGFLANTGDRFRLASLYVDALLSAGRRKIAPSYLEELLKMPNSLYAFYDEILGRIQEDRLRKDAFTALRWIMFAAESFWLEDLVEACVVLPRPGQLIDEEARSYLHCLGLVEPLSGLIHIQPPLPENEGDQRSSRKHHVTLAHSFTFTGWASR